jgi:hypothetical protein
MLTVVSRLAHSLNEEPSRTASLEKQKLYASYYVETSELRKITNRVHLWEPFVGQTAGDLGIGIIMLSR